MSFTVLRAEESIYISSLDLCPSTYLSIRTSKKISKQISNKTQRSVFSNHDCITLAADREFSVYKVTDASFAKSGRRES